MHNASLSYTYHFQEQDHTHSSMHPQPLSEGLSSYSNRILQALCYAIKLQAHYMHDASLSYTSHFQEQDHTHSSMHQQTPSEG